MNTAEVNKLKQQIEKELRDLQYPWHRPLTRMFELTEEIFAIELRKQPVKAPQKPKLPYSIKQERRAPNGALILNRYEKGEPGYEQEQAEIHRGWLAQRRAKGYRDF